MKSSKAGRTGVEYSEVAAAIQALEAEGSKCTLKAIRNNLGTGSLGTIQRHVATYKAEQQASSSAVDIPTEITAALRGWVSSALSEAIQQLQQKTTELQATIDVLAADNTQLTEARDAGLEREEAMRTQLIRSEARLERQLAENAIRMTSLEVALAEARGIQIGVATETRLLSDAVEREKNRADTAAADVARVMSIVEKTLPPKEHAKPVVKRGREASSEARPTAS